MNVLLNKIKKANYKVKPLFFLQVVFFLIPFGGNLIPPAIILLVISILIFSKKEGWFDAFFKDKSYYLPLIGLFFIYMVGITWSDNVPNAFKKIEHVLSFLIFPLFIPFLNLTPKSVIKLFKTFVYGCMLILIISFLDFIYVSMSMDEYIILGEIAAGNRPGSVYEYLSQQFLIVHVHRTYFSIYLIICVAFILYYFNEYCVFFGKKIKWLGVFSLVLITAAMICMQSKAGLGLLILLVASFFIIKVKKTFWSVVLLIIFFLASLVLFKSILNYRFKPMIEEIEYILSPGSDNEKDYAKFLRPGSTEIRYMVYKSSFQLIEKAPFLGYGTGDVKDVLRTQNEKNNFVSIAHLNYGPHSQFLYILIAFGFLGLLVFISIFFFPILESFRMKEYFALSILIVIFLSGLTESVLIRQEGIIPISLFITILGRLKTNFRTL